MATIHLMRTSKAAKAIWGTLFLEGVPREITTLENANYIIPDGTYPVSITYSPRFQKNLPLIDKVPGRSGIRFHRGTKPEHSKGCILVSAVMEQELTAKWLALQANNEPIKIIIKNED